MHPKDQRLVRDLFGSDAIPVFDKGVQATQTTTGRVVMKGAKVAAIVGAVALLFGSVDFRS